MGRHSGNRPALTVIAVALLCGLMHAHARAASATIAITGTVTAYATIVLVPEAWRFQLEGRYREVSGDFEYRDPGYSPGEFYLLVSSNTPVRVSVDSGQVTVGSESYGPVLRFGLAAGAAGRLLQDTCSLSEPAGCTIYDSAGPVTNARIDLTDFLILAGQPVAAGDMKGFVQITITPY